MRVHAKRAGVLLGGLMTPALSMADWTLNMSPGVTGTSNEIFSLHMTILWNWFGKRWLKVDMVVMSLSH